MKNRIITLIIYLAASILLIVGPNTIFKVCEVMEEPMKCHWSIRAEIGIAIILIVTAVLYLITKEVREKLLLTILAIAINIIAILIPLVLIGGCSMKTMACQVRTFPAIYTISSVTIIYSLFNIFYLIRNKKHRKVL